MKILNAESFDRFGNAKRAQRQNERNLARPISGQTKTRAINLASPRPFQKIFSAFFNTLFARPTDPPQPMSMTQPYPVHLLAIGREKKGVAVACTVS
jgi:hypothetical protein